MAYTNTPNRKFSAHRYQNKKSYRNIKLTSHSILRAEERLGISKKDELKKIASQAKFNGINTNLIQRDNYHKFNLSWDEYLFLKGTFNPRESKIYLYKGNIFVFAGKGSNTLKTVINIGDKK